MRKFFLAAIALLGGFVSLRASDPWKDGVLLDRTLRVDYMFSGTSRSSSISVSELVSLDGWHGRRVNLKRIPVEGNGRLTMTDAATGDTLYRMSFSSLFQEWQATEEATRVTRSFENVFLVPMPARMARISLELSDNRAHVVAQHSFEVDPGDILIRPVRQDTPYKYIRRSGSSKECIDVAIVAEGYTKSGMKTFYKDAETAVDALLEHEPFASMKDRFNFIAVACESRDSGVSVPRRGDWRRTAVSSHFDTFYSDRYLTTLHLKDLHNILSGIPYEHIIILANTNTYGGGGIYNSYTLTTAHHPLFRPVVVHEFGHSFGALADEYYYDDQYEEYYVEEIEPWEQNITTMADFSSKWEDMVGRDGVGLHEGGGYRSKGVWRGCEDCRMKTNTAPAFCPVCQRAIARMTEFYTVEGR